MAVPSDLLTNNVSSANLFALPLENPVLIFSLILFIILFAPIVLNKFKIPHLVGLIFAGIIIGPYGLNLMLRDSSIVLFGTVGLLYIMFLAGLEIDMAGFKKNSGKSLVFGLYTFTIPMGLGILAGIFLLDFSILTSVLLASMFASHTLIAYPIVSRLGIAKNRAVSIAVGGTMITDTLALLVLAVIVRMATGDLSNTFWVQLSLSILAFGMVVVFLFPLIARWFFKRFDDNISQYIFVLGLVFLGAFLAEAAGIEAIIGAFLVGLALNRLILDTSALMNRIEFVGNALFIPFFLIGVGMLIDYRSFFQDFETLKVAVVMTLVATLAKYMAAWFTQKTFRLSADERRLIFGLSNAQAAATLAAVLVGYNIVLGYEPGGEPIRLLGESVLNGAILMILITCTHASFSAQKGAQGIALSETADEQATNFETTEKILIPVNNPDTVNNLVELSLTVKSKKNRVGLYALKVIENTEEQKEEKAAKKLLDTAESAAAAAGFSLNQLLRYDLNIVNGIVSVIKEHKITDLVLGISQKKGISESFVSNITEGVLTKSDTTTLIYKSFQPLATIKRHLVVIPEKAEKEIGFAFWLVKLWNIARNTGVKFSFYGHAQTLAYIRGVHKKHPISASFTELSSWDDFLILSGEIKTNDNLIIVLSRKDHLSYNPTMNKIPSYLNKYFKSNSFILVYPIQSGVGTGSSFDMRNISLLDPLRDNFSRLDSLIRFVLKLFKKPRYHDRPESKPPDK